VGRDHFAFRDVLERGRDSIYADWFKVEFDEDGRVLRYEAWDRTNGALPEFRQTRDGDLAPGPKAHVFAVTRRWMDPDGDGDPSDGVDGWRLDVAAEVGRAFWRDWRAHVRSINPDAVLVGEIWDDAELWFNGVAFDAQMNYPVASAVADWLAIGPEGSDSAGLVTRLRVVLAHHPAHEAAQMTLIASHDTERGASLMHNATPRAFDTGATPWLSVSSYDAGPASAAAKRRLLTAFALLVALPGSPMVYNGDEFALPGADDPDNRRPIPWPGDRESGEADGAFADALAGLLTMRSDPRFSDLLRHGSVEIMAVDADRLVVRRVLNGRMLELAVARVGEPRFGAAERGWEVTEYGVFNGACQDGDAVLRWRLLSAETGR
jgi:glycosidase